MRDRLYRTEAVILRRMDYGEADRILTLYTPHYGKLRVISKGVRKMTSKLAGHLELFLRTQLMLATGRTFDVVTGAQIVEPYRQLHDDLARVSHAYYVAELLDKLTVDDEENRPAYDLLVAALQALDITNVPDLVVRSYELHLLGFMGYRPHLFDCVNCQEPLAEDANRWSASGGGMLCPRCAPSDPHALPISLPAFKALRFLQREPITSVDQLRLSDALRHELESILRATLRPVLERDLKSVAFLNAVRDN